MSSAYGRALSPPRTNRYHPAGGPPGPRSSAGSFFYEPYAPPARSSRDYVPAPRASAERTIPLNAPPIRTRSPPRRVAVDDYAVPVRARPRRATLEHDPQRIRRPLSMITPTSPTRSSRPIVTSAIDSPPSPISKVRRDYRDDDYEVMPATSSSRRHHQRHSSLNTTDPGHLVPLDRDPREKSYRPSTSTRPAIRERQGETDRDYGFEYTDAREALVQDPVYRQRSRKDSYNSAARPTSMIFPDGYTSRSNRDPGPPVSSRGFENIGRSESQRQGYRARDDERLPKEYRREDREVNSRKPVRPEIALHQPSDDVYAEEESRHHRSRKVTPEDERLDARPRTRKEDERLEPKSRDGHDDQHDRSGEERHRKHRHKHHHRDHDRHRDDDERDDRDHRVRDDARDRREKNDDGRSSNGMLAGAGAAAAATGLAAEEYRRNRHKEPRAEERSSRRHRDVVEEDKPSRVYRDDEEESRRSRRPRDHLGEPARDALETSSVSTGPSISENEDREYREAREEERRARHNAEAFIGPIEPALREQASYERRPEPDYTRHHRTYRPRRHHSRTRDEDSYSSSSSSSSSDSEDDKKPRQPRVVEPSTEDKPPPAPPKGILRKPRDRFPEHPATEREGVAPHKDDLKKKNVPPGARWTKINRQLVNPEALEQDGIRFNEFPDHVIVLKVMDKDEIMKYAKKTAEIREARRLSIMNAPPPPPPASLPREGSGGSVAEAPLVPPVPPPAPPVDARAAV